MKAIIGKKIGMTTVFDSAGNARPVTVIEALPNSVTQIKTVEKDGYQAVQIGYGSARKAKKPQQGQLKKARAQVGRHLTELKIVNGQTMPNLGSSIKVEDFQIGDLVDVVGISLGKGFAGTVKRHHFKMGPRSHGSKNIRKPGSIGSTYPQRVILGKRMGGRMGGVRTTVKHLKVIDILPEKHLLLISGSVPGLRGSRLFIKVSSRLTAQTIAQ